MGQPCTQKTRRTQEQVIVDVLTVLYVEPLILSRLIRKANLHTKHWYRKLESELLDKGLISKMKVTSTNRWGYTILYSITLKGVEYLKTQKR